MWALSCQDENGHGVVHVHVRKDKDTFEFSYMRTLPGEKLNLVVSSAKKDKFKKKEAGRYRLAIQERCAASVHEVTPRCQHFAAEKCGGCSFQNLRLGDGVVTGWLLAGYWLVDGWLMVGRCLVTGWSLVGSLLLAGYWLVAV
eukprot:Skav233156  [mRNA]  locus=scaffold1669:336844:338145:+ [translate_table: standard]